MRSVAFCLPYYMNQGMLDRQIQCIAALPRGLRDLMEMIVVDDGSPDKPKPAFRSPGCPLRVFRIAKDVKWNQDAARNIAAFEAKSKWLLLTDIDHLVPHNTWQLLSEKKLNKDYVYKFALRKTLDRDGAKPSISEYKPHPNSWIMTRGMYWKIGGYDERFAGNYGTDGDFRDNVLRHSSIEQLQLPIWRVPRTTIADASTTTLQRKVLEEGQEIRRIKNERETDPDWRPLSLQFEYSLIGSC